MKLLILHLSDLHFGKKNNFQNYNITAIVSALQQSIKCIETVIILVSGDLAYSGKKGECIQVARFLNLLKESIVNRYNIHDVIINFVPGNHDIDYTDGDKGSVGLKKIEELDSYKKHIKNELEKQKQFYTLAQRFQCFEKGELIQKKIYTYGEKKIQINLINTAIFSSLDNDQGYHYLPDVDIDLLKEQNDSDYILSIMHHPHHWYSSRCKKKLEEALYTRSDIIFVGHEHYESTQKVEEESASVNIFAGGKLSNQGDWTDSEFHIGVLDIDTREYISKKYHWHSSAGIYECLGDSKPIQLSKNRYTTLGLSLSPKNTHELYEDKYILTENVLDYFVFPLLIEERVTEDNGRLPEEISDIQTFITYIKEKKKVIISGYNGSGKSVLARAIFQELSQTKLVLFVDGKDFSGSNEGTIRDSFEKMYSKEPSKYQAFLQMEPDNLIVIIDDIDAINEKKQESFIDYLTDHFGKIIMTCQSEIDVDIKSRLKKRVSLEESLFFHISRFYSDKRKELVTRIVHCIGDGDTEAQEKTIGILCEALTTHKYLYSWNPDFLVQFVKYYCKNVGEASQNDGSVFSKVFEANLVSLIKPFARKDLSVEKILVVLDKIAFYIFKNKRYPISVSEIDSVIHDYNVRYGSKIETFGFVKILLQAKIIKIYNDGFLFYERNYLAYFAAREIKRECSENRFDQFRHLLEYSYMQINMDILLFITYMVDSPSFIKSIMEKAMEIVNGWKEFDFSNSEIQFLIGGPAQAIGPVSEKEADYEEQRSVAQEREEAKELFVKNDATIFEGETEELDFIQRIMRAISLLIIVARTLPSFEQIMEIKEKEKCVNLIYMMPLQIFQTLAEQMDEDSGDLIRQIKDYHDWVYRKEELNGESLSDEKALFILRWEASSMLLELMNSAFANATRPNTADYIDAYPYVSKQTYSIEHLISLNRRDDLANFKKEAFDLFEKSKVPMVQSAVQRITKHFMVKSKKIKASDRDSINARIFGARINRAKLLAETTRNRGKN